MVDSLIVRQVFDRIYLVSCKSQYDTAMHFLRYQEFYESPEQQFRNKQFLLTEYMRWYSVERNDADGSFSYPNDWVGFNLPCHILNDVLFQTKILDENVYDAAMRNMYETLKAKEGDNPFYIIGCVENGTAIEHELAHGLWYVSSEYKAKMQANITWLDGKYKKQAAKLRALLIEEGYCEDVIEDELQAYLSTGLTDVLKPALKRSEQNTIITRFENTFAKYRSKATLPWLIDRKKDEK